MQNWKHETFLGIFSKRKMIREEANKFINEKSLKGEDFKISEITWQSPTDLMIEITVYYNI